MHQRGHRLPAGAGAPQDRGRRGLGNRSTAPAQSPVPAAEPADDRVSVLGLPADRILFARQRICGHRARPQWRSGRAHPGHPGPRDRQAVGGRRLALVPRQRQADWHRGLGRARGHAPHAQHVGRWLSRAVADRLRARRDRAVARRAAARRDPVPPGRPDLRGAETPRPPEQRGDRQPRRVVAQRLMRACRTPTRSRCSKRG